MEWKDLSNEAKSVIEWVENPFTNKREIIEIKIGEHFQRKFSMYSETDVNILITAKLYNEILEYVTTDNELQCEQFTDSLIFKIKDSSNLKLH